MHSNHQIHLCWGRVCVYVPRTGTQMFQTGTDIANKKQIPSYLSAILLPDYILNWNNINETGASHPIIITIYRIYNINTSVHSLYDS